MGTSQSSYYTQRLLLIAEPGLLDGAILDSVLPSDVSKIPQSEAIANHVGLDLMTRCAQDPNCASHFPQSNPIRTLYELRLDYDNPDGLCRGLYLTYYSTHSGCYLHDD